MPFPRSKNVTLEVLRSQQRKRPLSEVKSPKEKLPKKRPRHEKTIDEPPQPTKPTQKKLLHFPEGSTVLAYVTEQSSNGLKLDVPGGRRGFAPLEDGTQTNLQGRYVLAAVVAPDEKYRNKSLIPLTVQPSTINKSLTWPPARNQSFPVRVISLEEHGYTAISEVPIFDESHRIFVKCPPLSDHQQCPSLKAGSIRIVVVDSVKKESKLVVCVEEEFCGPRYLRSDQTLDVNVILPGQLVQCSVVNVVARAAENVNSKGLQPMTRNKHSATKLFSPARCVEVCFSQTISGFVHYVHLHNPLITLSDEVQRMVESGKDESVSGKDESVSGKNDSITVDYPFLDKGTKMRPKKVGRQDDSNQDENRADDDYLDSEEKEKSAAAAKSRRDDALTKYREVPKRARRIAIAHSLLARIISVVPGEDGTLHFQLSLLPQILFMDHKNPYLARLTSLQLGTLFKSARVGAVDKQFGLQMFHSTETANENVKDEDLKEWKMDFSESVLLHCSKKRFSDTGSETYLLNVSVGQKVDTRLVAVNLLDATAEIAASEKYMSAKFIAPNEVRLGTLVKGTVTKVLPWGAFVTVNDFVVARCLKTHFTDTSRSDEVMKKLKEGDVKKFRALVFDRAKGCLYLTAKKSMLNMAVECIETQLKNVEEWPVNFISDGYVAGHSESGVFIRGFGNFCGTLPFADIWKTLSSSARRSEPLSENERQKILDLPQFRIGVSIRCRVCKKLSSTSDGSIRAVFSIDLDGEDPVKGGVVSTSGGESLSNLDLLSLPLKDRRNKFLKLPFPIEPLDASLCERALSFIPVGTEIEGQVIGLNSRIQSMTVAIWGPLLCTVHATELFDEPWPKYPLESFTVGDCVKVRITGSAPEDVRSFSPTLLVLEGSLRSKEGSGSLPRSVKDICVGKPYNGVIKNSNLKGVFVCISPTVRVRVKRRELDPARLRKAEANGKIPNSDEAFQFAYPVGKRVTNLRVLSVSLSASQAEGSLIPSELNQVLGIDESDQPLSFDSVKVGQALAGNVKRLTSFGVFITLRPGLDVLCPLDEVHDDDRKVDLNVGDLVLVKVLKKNEALKRIVVGLKSSYFNDLEIRDVAKDIDDGSESSETEEDNDEEGDSCVNDLLQLDSGTLEEEDRLHQTASDDDELKENVQTLNDEEDEDFVSELIRRGEKKKKEGVTRTTSSGAGEINEAEIRAIERRNAAGEWMNNPTTVDDFERLILLKGKDAEVWIRYIAYYLELKDVSAARKIAWRGIESMTFELQEERRKIWLAWLNFETEFGTPESLRETVNKAVEYNEPKQIYLHVMDVLEAKGDFKAIDDITARMLFKSKMAGKYTTCWVKYLITLYTRAEGEEITGMNKDISTRQQIDECLRLAKHRLGEKEKTEGVLTLAVTSARLEFKYGQVEKARTQFLRILKDRKTRTDLWMVFFDAEMSHLTRRAKSLCPRPLPSQDIQNARQSFRELAKLDLKPSKMKPLFSRWMDFEKQNGSQLTINECQEAAQAYVASKLTKH